MMGSSLRLGGGGGGLRLIMSPILRLPAQKHTCKPPASQSRVN